MTSTKGLGKTLEEQSLKILPAITNPTLLSNAKLDHNGLSHFTPKRVPRNLEVLRYLSSRINIVSRSTLHLSQLTAKKIIAIWRSMGSGFSGELLDRRISRKIMELHSQYYNAKKSIYGRRRNVNTKAVRRLDKLLKEIFFPFPLGKCFNFPKRSEKFLTFPTICIKASRLTVPSFGDLYDDTKTLSEWCGASVTSGLGEAYGVGESYLHSIESPIPDGPEETVEMEDIEEDTLHFNTSEGGNADCRNVAENCMVKREISSANDELPREKVIGVECHRTYKRDTSTQTNLIIPSDIFIPEGRSVRVKFIFEDVDSV